MAITVFLSRSPGLLNRGPTLLGSGFLYRILFPTATAQSGAWGPTLLGVGFLYRILSPTATAQSGAWGPSLLDARFLYRILSPTDWTSCAPSYIVVRRPPSSCRRHKSHSFNPSRVKVIFWYSSTGCTCYLHRCISYFDSPAGSEVNIQYRHELGDAFVSQNHKEFRVSFSGMDSGLCIYYLVAWSNFNFLHNYYYYYYYYYQFQLYFHFLNIW